MTLPSIQGDRHINPFELDDSIAGKLSSERQAHLGRCSACRAELAMMQAARQRFGLEVAPRVWPILSERIDRQSWRWRAWLAPLVLVPTFAALLVMVSIGQRSVQADPKAADVRWKGSANVQVLARRADRVFQVKDGMQLQAGDLIRFQVEPAGLEYAIIGSVDARANANLIFPATKSESGRIDPRARFTPDGSSELDDSCGPERVFVLLSHQPVPADRFLGALTALGREGEDALRKTTSLASLTAGTQWSLSWEKCGR